MSVFLFFVCAAIFLVAVIIPWGSVGYKSSWAHPIGAALCTIAALAFATLILAWHFQDQAKPSATKQILVDAYKEFADV